MKSVVCALPVTTPELPLIAVSRHSWNAQSRGGGGTRGANLGGKGHSLLIRESRFPVTARQRYSDRLDWALIGVNFKNSVP